jgi:hypothetical protein
METIYSFPFFISFAISFAGFSIAVTALKENIKNNERDSVQKTLSFFEEGKNTRYIATTYIKNRWLKERKYDVIIVPALIQQLRILIYKIDLSLTEWVDVSEILELLHEYVQISHNAESYREEIRIIIDSTIGNYRIKNNRTVDMGSMIIDVLSVWVYRFESCKPKENFIFPSSI